jgi:transposase
MDNLAGHKAPVVHRWLAAHPRFVLHFTPTCSSWINQVERWFAELQRGAGYELLHELRARQNSRFWALPAAALDRLPFSARYPLATSRAG